MKIFWNYSGNVRQVGHIPTGEEISVRTRRTVLLVLIMMISLAGCGGESVTTMNAPANLVGTSWLASVILDWDPVTDATSYNIYRSVVSGAVSSKTLLVSTLPATAYTDTAVSSGTTYYYQVIAVNSAGESQASNEIAVTPE